MMKLRLLNLVLSFLALEVHSFHATNLVRPAQPFLSGSAIQSSRQRGRKQSAIFSQDSKEDTPQVPEPDEQSDDEQKKSGFLPGWVSRWTSSSDDKTEESESSTPATVVASNEASPDAPAAIPVSNGSKAPTKDLTPVERAQLLKAQAEKARLEAERMDAELTLDKISRLERELAVAKEKGTDSVETLQRQMASLQAKLTGEKVKPAPAPRSPVEPTSATTESEPVKPVAAMPLPRGDFLSKLPEAVEKFDQKQYDEILADFEKSPEFLKKVITAQLGFDYPEDGKVNSTAVASRLDEIRRFDFAFVNEKERPSFTQKDIDGMKERLQANWLTAENAFLPDTRLKEASDGNETELALMCLEYEYFNSKYELSEDKATNFFEDEQVIAELSNAIQQFSFDSATESTFPPCTRKEDQQPTMAQAQSLVKDVLPKSMFTSTSKPMAVPGGFIIKGNSKAEDGDALIASIDQQLSRSSLKDKVTVCFVSDFTAFVTESADEIDLDNIGTVLFVGGPDIAREPKKVLLSLTSAIGLGTCWYLSLYPFLLNPNLAKRVDEQLALVDAGMPADLSWLTDLSFPLFATFVSIQFLHEMGHRVVAVFNDIKPTFPTFVPSIITGVTSLTTSFKEPPKNLQALFDFSIAGPLLGMLGSVAAIVIGTQLSIGADPTNFPALPLEILRQSSLGGGIIESILGSGILSVPDAARGSQAVAAMTIPLHPVAVAGYISLVVNALSMLPIGTTDGGRVAMALFGRQTKQAIGGLAFLSILFFGVQGSDLFLFYFAFCLAFQKGNEIPCRNEVDTPDFSRVIVSTGAYFIALLALIPFQ